MGRMRQTEPMRLMRLLRARIARATVRRTERARAGMRRLRTGWQERIRRWRSGLTPITNLEEAVRSKSERGFLRVYVVNRRLIGDHETVEFALNSMRICCSPMTPWIIGWSKLPAERGTLGCIVTVLSGRPILREELRWQEEAGLTIRLIGRAEYLPDCL